MSTVKGPLNEANTDCSSYGHFVGACGHLHCSIEEHLRWHQEHGRFSE